MQELQHYRRLFQYDAWANREVIANLKKSEKPPARALKFLGHIIAAEFVWLERITGEAQSLAVWPEFSLAQCGTYLEEIIQKWRAYFATLTAEGLRQPIAYTNTKGETFRTPVEEILMHVVMHAAYHRGQIALETRGAGQAPAYTDFVHAARSGFLE